MKIKIELTPDEVDLAIRSYIRQSGMAIPDDGEVSKIFLGRLIEPLAFYEVEIE